MLLVKGLNVSYGDVQVLFDVDLEVDEGEVIALLGTNGAGKSTLLASICGLVPANKGAVIFDGRDITYAPPHEIAPRGVVLLPGGRATFPSLTVAENLRAAGWIDRRATGRSAPLHDVHVERQVASSRRARRRRMFRDLLPLATCREPRQPVGRPAADARPRHGVPVAAPPRDDRRAVARPRAGDHRAARRHHPPDARRRRDDHRRRAVRERRAHARVRGATSWRRARSASTARPRSCCNGPTCLRSVFLGRRARRPAATSLPGTSRTPTRRAALELVGLSRSFGGIRCRRRRLASPSARARSSASSARTARARRRCSTSSPASRRSTPAGSSSAAATSPP